MVEEFRIIKGFENYSISNLGRVRNNATDRILKPGIDGRGYYYVNLCKDGTVNAKKIHKLVGEYFIANPYNKQFIDHINNDKLDNNVRNLRYVTNQENQMNRKLNSNNTSNYKGVFLDKRRKKNGWHI